MSLFSLSLCKQWNLMFVERFSSVLFILERTNLYSRHRHTNKNFTYEVPWLFCFLPSGNVKYCSGNKISTSRLAGSALGILLNTILRKGIYARPYSIVPVVGRIRYILYMEDSLQTYTPVRIKMCLVSLSEPLDRSHKWQVPTVPRNFVIANILH